MEIIDVNDAQLPIIEVNGARLREMREPHIVSRIKYSNTGSDLGYHDFACAFQQYSEPQPIDTYFAPEILREG